jgi:energy-coupling factor transporter ATP-binding protein EcfA2
MPILEIKSSDRICVAGLTGMGKTTLTRYLASLAAPNILVMDPLHQYDGLPEKCRYFPARFTPAEMEVKAKWMCSVSNMTLLVEEAEQFMPQKRPLGDHTKQLIDMGRNWGAGVWGSTRRIQNLNKDFFDICDHLFFYRCGLTSRAYIAKMIGSEYIVPAEKPLYNKTGYTITTLPPYHCLHFNLKDETAEVITLETGARPHIKFLSRAKAPKPKKYIA